MTDLTNSIAKAREDARQEAQREFAPILARAKLKAQAAEDGINLPEEFLDLLDYSKMVGEDSNPSAEIITLALTPFQSTKNPEYAQGLGLGRQGPSLGFAPPAPLDARMR
ncbi:MULTISPECIES: hypothetical protein [Kitasatospora]|uniref:hypothetical protein n=1 Tax=Kitasatospora TaxID=2063 RepID=UPI0011D2ABEF|nr:MULTISPECIES: hypothetical protein [Kitasatospora]